MVVDDSGRRVIARERYPYYAVWGPERARMAFAAVPKAGFDYVSLVTRSGRHERRVTGFGWGFPSWSPGGRLTAACARPGACESRPGLYVIDPARPESMRRIRRTADASASAWSPGGRRIVFVRARQGRGELYLKRIGRPRLRRLTSSGIDEAAPDWSPDGRWIVYSRPPRRPNQPHDLWLVRPNGRHSRPLTKTSANETNPAFSPSGRRILFATGRGLFSIRRDGTRRRTVAASWAGDCCPDW